MTGDDQLRRPEDIIERVYQLAKQGKDATTPAIRDVYALIRQDRRELLTRLSKMHFIADNETTFSGRTELVFKSYIDAELQRLTGLEEADHE